MNTYEFKNILIDLIKRSHIDSLSIHDMPDGKISIDVTLCKIKEPTINVDEKIKEQLIMETKSALETYNGVC